MRATALSAALSSRCCRTRLNSSYRLRVGTTSSAGRSIADAKKPAEEPAERLRRAERDELHATLVLECLDLLPGLEPEGLADLPRDDDLELR